MIETLESLDQSAMLFLNGMHNGFFDVFMEGISRPVASLPVYVLIMILLGKRYGLKSLLVQILVLGLLIAATDQGCNHLFKNMFQRYRPCHNMLLAPQLHVVGSCTGLYGFISGHAANTFAVAVYAGKLLGKRALLLLLLWSSFIGYSRIYLGMHYPADVLGGAVWGSGLALLFVRSAAGLRLTGHFFQSIKTKS